MDTLHAIFLGILQGLTEFLPVSSSGHLVMMQEIFGIEEADVAFDVILHLGTLVAVFTYFYRDVVNLIIEFFRLVYELFSNNKSVTSKQRDPYRRMFIMIIVATIPTVVIGFLFKDLFEQLFNSLNIVGFTLLITGAMLWLSNHMLKGRKTAKDIKYSDALIIGALQGLAITPGISRSGATIFGGLSRGFNRELATKFSFLLSIPAILGAVILEGKDILVDPTGYRVNMFIAGFVAATLSGYIAIRVLISFLNKQKLTYFSYYCWAVGVFVILYSLFTG